MPKKASPIYQLKVTLLDTEPPIWRRILVEGDVTLAKLSTVINDAMGWAGYHIHEFHVGKDIWGPPLNIDDDFGFEMKDHAKTTLDKVAPRKRSVLKYLYDGGDCWMHKVVVEDIVDAEPKRDYPVCLEGERACPPEDCGGTPGFYDMLDAMADRKHPEHKNLTEWLGGKFDSQKFNLREVNKSLRKLGSAPRPPSAT